MLFLEPWFWAFVAFAVPGYWLCPRPFKLAWLIITSLTFHWHFAGAWGMAPVLALSVFCWAAGLVMARGQKRLVGVLGCAVVVASLLFYKYSEFLLETAVGVADLAGLAIAPSRGNWRAPAAPLGISFVTFQLIHYLYEVSVRAREPVRSPARFAAFALLFPALASGPIKRFPDFVPQLAELRNPTPARIATGIRRVIHGLFKKVCVADVLARFVVVIEDVPSYSAPLVVLIAVLQGFRIYYDFAGYSDMAIGIAQLFNLRIPENFHRPFFATSLGEFWRRWHMSLTSWIRDYVYVPLGGHVVLAMAICGLWHGAAWNFVAWGVYHGVGLWLEARLRRWRPELFGRGALRAALRWVVLFSFLGYSWLLFFYPLGTVWRMTGDAFAWCLGTGRM
jgi:alginate O-acetyltransferase complex protein AlgI